MCSGRKELVQKSIIDLIVDSVPASLPPEYIFHAGSVEVLPGSLAPKAESKAEGGEKNQRRNTSPKQRNAHISTPRRPQKLSIGPFCAEFQGGALGRGPEA